MVHWMSNVEYVFNKHSPQQHRKVEVTTNNSLHDISTQNTLYLLIYGATCRIWSSLADCARLTPGLACRCAVTAWQPQAAAWGTRWRPQHSQRTSESCSQRPNAYSFTTELLLPHWLSVRLLIWHWGEAYWNINGKCWQCPPIATMFANNPSILTVRIYHSHRKTLRNHALNMRHEF